jgi:lysophospholipase L1-like esterase
MKPFFAAPLLALCALVGARCAAAPLTLPVDSPAFVFSPGNWTGDQGRGGSAFRQTWNPGAYFRVTWESDRDQPAAKLLLDASSYAGKVRPPQLAYCIDGVWRSKVACAPEIAIEELAGAGRHELCVYFQQSEQRERWGGAGASGANVLRVSGLQVDAGAKPVAAPRPAKWALIVGDSITEGIGASELACYSYLVGQALRTRGYEYGLSACGWSGWINRGDNPPGDVPGYYVVTNSVNGAGGEYLDDASRWNKIDGNGHSLLDARGRISAYGEAGQEPALILINYGTNDSLHRSNPSDTRASISQCLSALRASAPDAQIVLLIPFGQYYASELKQAAEQRRRGAPADAKIAVIDLGPAVAKALAVKSGVLGGLHPNDRGHALLAAQLIPQLLDIVR